MKMSSPFVNLFNATLKNDMERLVLALSAYGSPTSDRFVSYDEFVGEQLYTRWFPIRVVFPNIWSADLDPVDPSELDLEFLDFIHRTCKGKFMVRCLPSEMSYYVISFEKKEDLMMFKLVFSEYV